MRVFSHLLLFFSGAAAASANNATASTAATAVSVSPTDTTDTTSVKPTGGTPTPDKNNPDMNPMPHTNHTVSVTFHSGNKDVHVTGVSEYGVDNFLGIPFAQPHRRFAAPAPARYNSTLNATTPKPACIQTTTSPVGDMSGKHGMSEDCLTLNILAPSERPPNLPVLVYLHGGGFFCGTATTYNSPYIIWHGQKIGQPFILVTVNYRLGIFGWGYGEEMKSRGAANLGLRDQMLALQWVRDNIKAFGGDPKRVTVMGESAGSVSISMLLLNESSNLFRGAIMQSGVNSRYSTNVDTWQKPYEDIAKVVGCPPGVAGGNHSDEDPHIMSNGSGASTPSTASSTGGAPSTRIWFNSTFDCLKSRPADALNKANLAQFDIGGLMFGPKIDGDLIPADPVDSWYEGRMRQVPLIVGDTKDEGTYFIPPNANSTEQIETIVLGRYPPEFRRKVMAAYPDDPAAGRFKKGAAIAGDLNYHADRRQLVRQANAHGFTRTWTYQFEAHTPGLPPYLGATHGTDVLFSFGGVSTDLNFTQADVDLQNEMMTRFLNFVYHLDPNGAPKAAEGGEGGSNNSKAAKGKSSAPPSNNSSTTRLILWQPHTAENRAIIHWTPGNVTMGEDTFREKSMQAIFRDKNGDATSSGSPSDTPTATDPNSEESAATSATDAGGTSTSTSSDDGKEGDMSTDGSSAEPCATEG